MKKTKNKLSFFVVCMVIFLGISACGGIVENTEVVLTTGFASDEIFRIESISATLPEVMVYLTNTQNEYESVYGAKIWETDLEGITLQENVKETVLAKIAQIKTMTLLAKNHEIILDEDELLLVQLAAKEYYASLNETEIEVLNIAQDDIATLYGEYALADKVYQDIIKDVNPEISDDEARTITIQQIFFKTYRLDSSGKKDSFSNQAKEVVFQKAKQVMEQIQQGIDFEELMDTYNEDSVRTFSFGKGEKEAAFEQAAFQLGNDEISNIIETEDGYYILKCISTFNRQETDANKIKIVEQRKKQAFNEEYDNFVETLKKNLNSKLWKSVTFIHDEKVTTRTFFEVYNRYFQVD